MVIYNYLSVPSVFAASMKQKYGIRIELGFSIYRNMIDTANVSPILYRDSRHSEKAGVSETSNRFGHFFSSIISGIFGRMNVPKNEQADN